MIPVLVLLIVGSAAPMYAMTSSTGPNLFPIAALLFAGCMFTDWLDGYLARRWKVTSDFGRMLDPIADKLLVAACLIAIVIVSYGAPIVLAPALIIIGRDIFVSGIREHAANANIILSPTKLAKWKTACEMFAILLFLFAMVIFKSGVEPGPIVNPMNASEEHEFMIAEAIYGALDLAFLAVLWLAAILSAYTGFHYFRSAMRKNA